MSKTDQSVDRSSTSLADIQLPSVAMLDRPLLGCYRFVSMVPLHGEELMTLIHIPSVFERVFGTEPSIKRYLGKNLTWRSFPDFKRISLEMDRMLSDFYARAIFERDSASA